MYRDNDRYRTFSRRAVFLFGSKFLLMSGLIGRMYYLQVIEGDRYKTLADENRISLKLLAPPQGPNCRSVWPSLGGQSAELPNFIGA